MGFRNGLSLLSDACSVAGREKAGTYRSSHPVPQGALVLKKPPANAGNVGDVGSTLGLGRPQGAGNNSPLQYSCPEHSTGREAWWATVWVHRESDTTE